MKETYIAPKVEIVEFDGKTDIICTSGATGTGLFNDPIGKGVEMEVKSYNLLD